MYPSTSCPASAPRILPAQFFTLCESTCMSRVCKCSLEWLLSKFHAFCLVHAEWEPLATICLLWALIRCTALTSTNISSISIYGITTSPVGKLQTFAACLDFFVLSWDVHCPQVKLNLCFRSPVCVFSQSQRRLVAEQLWFLLQICFSHWLLQAQSKVLRGKSRIPDKVWMNPQFKS